MLIILYSKKIYTVNVHIKNIHEIIYKTVSVHFIHIYLLLTKNINSCCLMTYIHQLNTIFQHSNVSAVNQKQKHTTTYLTTRLQIEKRHSF